MSNPPSHTYSFECPACQQADAFMVFVRAGDVVEWASEQHRIGGVPSCDGCTYTPSQEEENDWCSHAWENVAEDVYTAGQESRWEAMNDR